MSFYQSLIYTTSRSQNIHAQIHHQCKRRNGDRCHLINNPFTTIHTEHSQSRHSLYTLQLLSRQHSLPERTIYINHVTSQQPSSQAFPLALIRFTIIELFEGNTNDNFRYQGNASNHFHFQYKPETVLQTQKINVTQVHKTGWSGFKTCPTFSNASQMQKYV